MPTRPVLLALAALAVPLAGCGSDAPNAISPSTVAPPADVPADAGASVPKAPRPAPLTLEGGRHADAATAREVRAVLRRFAVAVGERDVATVCATVVGVERLAARVGREGVDCETLMANSGNSSSPPPASLLRALRGARVSVRGDRAVVTTAAGAPPLRRVGGTWKVDYGALVQGAVGD